MHAIIWQRLMQCDCFIHTFTYHSISPWLVRTQNICVCNQEVICCKCLFRLIYKGCMALSPQPSWLYGLSSLISAPTGCNADSGTEPSCYFICEDVLGLPSDSHRLLVASRVKVYSYCIGIRILLTSKARCGDILRGSFFYFNTNQRTKYAQEVFCFSPDTC